MPQIREKALQAALDVNRAMPQDVGRLLVVAARIEAYLRDKQVAQGSNANIGANQKVQQPSPAPIKRADW